jgi:hypothetical protein
VPQRYELQRASAYYPRALEVLEYLNETDGIERLLREKSLQWPAVNVNVQVRAGITRHGFVRLNARYLQANAPDACGDEAGRGAAGSPAAESAETPCDVTSLSSPPVTSAVRTEARAPVAAGEPAAAEPRSKRSCGGGKLAVGQGALLRDDGRVI